MNAYTFQMYTWIHQKEFLEVETSLLQLYYILNMDMLEVVLDIR